MKEPARFGILKVIFLAVLAWIAFAVIFRAVDGPPLTKADAEAFNAQVRKGPQRQSLMDGYFEVDAASSKYWTFTVEQSMIQPRVIGHFSASGGFGNDIQVALGETDEIMNWMNHHPSRLLYTTPQQTAGSFEVPIPKSGSYTLALYNGQSLFSKKTVSIKADVRYLPY